MLKNMTRKLLIEQIANHISSMISAHPLRVAIDGVDAAGVRPHLRMNWLSH